MLAMKPQLKRRSIGQPILLSIMRTKVIFVLIR